MVSFHFKRANESQRRRRNVFVWSDFVKDLLRAIRALFGQAGQAPKQLFIAWPMCMYNAKLMFFRIFFGSLSHIIFGVKGGICDFKKFACGGRFCSVFVRVF
jgi:hypothetical protein